MEYSWATDVRKDAGRDVNRSAQREQTCLHAVCTQRLVQVDQVSNAVVLCSLLTLCKLLTHNVHLHADATDRPVYAGEMDFCKVALFLAPSAASALVNSGLQARGVPVLSN